MKNKKNIKYYLSFLIVCLMSTFAFGQNVERLNKFLDSRLKEDKINADTSSYNLIGKKYYYFKKTEDGESEIRRIIEFKENSEIQLVEVSENLKTKKITSHIYTGDVRRNKSIVSIYANKENDTKIALPKVYNLVLQIVDNIWYLIDFTARENWKEGKAK